MDRFHVTLLNSINNAFCSHGPTKLFINLLYMCTVILFIKEVFDDICHLFLKLTLRGKLQSNQLRFLMCTNFRF